MSFHIVTVFHVPNDQDASIIQEMAITNYDCQGVEEYALNEEEVDELLGERSYSGGDLPISVLDEVDAKMKSGDVHLKFFFIAEDELKAKEFSHYIRTTFLAEVQFETLEDQDWNAEWKKHYHPIEVGDSMVVLPEWSKIEVESHKTVIRIHPGMGFGTGSHETTFLCLKNFQGLGLIQSKAICLDYGSGSGILGIATLLKFPGTSVDFVDIDDDAHNNCKQNLVLNNLNPDRARLLLVSERTQLENSYPLVFANILENILHEEYLYLINKTCVQGFLILSGLLKYQVERTKELYLSSGEVELINTEILNDWGCLVFRKSR